MPFLNRQIIDVHGPWLPLLRTILCQMTSFQLQVAGWLMQKRSTWDAAPHGLGCEQFLQFMHVQIFHVCFQRYGMLEYVGIMGLLSILNIDMFSCLRERYIWLDNLEVHKWLTFYVLQESRSLVGCNLLQFSANKSGRQDTARTKHVHCPSLGKPVSPSKPSEAQQVSADTPCHHWVCHGLPIKYDH